MATTSPQSIQQFQQTFHTNSIQEKPTYLLNNSSSSPTPHTVFASTPNTNSPTQMNPSNSLNSTTFNQLKHRPHLTIPIYLLSSPRMCRKKTSNPHIQISDPTSKLPISSSEQQSNPSTLNHNELINMTYQITPFLSQRAHQTAITTPTNPKDLLVPSQKYQPEQKKNLITKRLSIESLTRFATKSSNSSRSQTDTTTRTQDNEIISDEARFFHSPIEIIPENPHRSTNPQRKLSNTYKNPTSSKQYYQIPASNISGKKYSVPSISHPHKLLNVKNNISPTSLHSSEQLSSHSHFKTASTQNELDDPDSLYQLESDRIKQRSSLKNKRDVLGSIIGVANSRRPSESTRIGSSQIEVSCYDQSQNGNRNRTAEQNQRKTQLLHSDSSLKELRKMKTQKNLTRTDSSPLHRNLNLFPQFAGTTQYASLAQQIAFNLASLKDLYRNDHQAYRQIYKRLTSFVHPVLISVILGNQQTAQIQTNVDIIEKGIQKIRTDFLTQCRKYGPESIDPETHLNPQYIKPQLVIIDEKLEALCLQKMSGKVQKAFDQVDACKERVEECLDELIFRGKQTQARLISDAYRCQFQDQRLTYRNERMATQENTLGEFPHISKESLLLSEQFESRLGNLINFNKNLNNPYKKQSISFNSFM